MATFRERLLYAMNEKNVTQIELARMTGLSAPQINQYTKGTYSPKPSPMKAIADALQVNVVWLMGYDVPMDAPTNKKLELTEQEIKLITYYRKLSTLGQDKVKGYVADIFDNDKYRKED